MLRWAEGRLRQEAGMWTWGEGDAVGGGHGNLPATHARMGTGASMETRWPESPIQPRLQTPFVPRQPRHPYQEALLCPLLLAGNRIIRQVLRSDTIQGLELDVPSC